MAKNTIIHEISLAGYKATSTGGVWIWAYRIATVLADKKSSCAKTV